MSIVRRIVIGLLATVGLLVTGAAAGPVANAQERTVNTFVVHLSPENEVPGCPAGVESGAGGVAVVQIDEITGEITYRVVAFNLPATIAGPSTGAHIHVQDPTSPTGLTGPIVVHFDRTGLDTETTTILGVELPKIKVFLNPGKNITVIAEVIAMNHLLRYSGVNPAEAFNERLIGRMREQADVRQYLVEDDE